MDVLNGVKSEANCRGSSLKVLACLKGFLLFLMMILVTCVVKLLRLFDRCCGIRTSKINPVFYEEWFSLNLGLPALQSMVRDLHLDLKCTAAVGGVAPNLTVFTMEGKNKRLIDFIRPGRPLVVNFGSCS